MIIALLGEATDPQIRHLHHHLLIAGHTPWVADTSRFGEDWSLAFDTHSFEGYFVINDRHIQLSEIKAAYWHRYIQPKRHDTACKSTLTDFSSALNCWFHYPGTRWVNGLEAVRYHQCKPAQLHHAVRLGAQVPRTWVGNHATSASHFCTLVHSPVIKPVHGGEVASRLTPNSDATLATRLARSPATLQHYVPGTNVRSYVVGDTLFHLELATTHVDFRTDDELLPVATTVPSTIESLAVALCRAFSMHWCAIDWRVTPDKQYYFLEANPCPYFLYAEQVTGLNITAALIDVLTQT